MNDKNLKPAIAPSLLATDPLAVGEAIDQLPESCSWLHVDIMDGHFVPNMNGQPGLVKAIKDRYEDKFISDVHLMVTDPDRVMDLYIDAGADVITVHQEVLYHHHRTLSYIRERGRKAGLSLNPATPLSTLEELLPHVDLILLMSVNPGYGGQHFIPQVLDKVKRLREMIDRTSYPILIEVDGGVNEKTAPELWEAGADVLVAGSAVFTHPDLDIAQAYEALLPRH